MSTPLLILTFLAIAVLIYLLGWRLLTRFFSLPCPPGYIFLLESPLFDRLAGAGILIKRAEIQPDMQVLDAGCGPGRVTVPLANYLETGGGQITAFDMQEGMLSRLRKRLRDGGLTNVEVIQGRFGDGLLPELRFDRAIMVSVLGEVPDQIGALKEIYRSLIPGGILTITEMIPDPHYLSPKTVARLGEKAGFQSKLAYRNWRSHTVNLLKSAD